MTSNTSSLPNTDIAQYIAVIEGLIQGHYRQDVPDDHTDEFAHLGQALQTLADTLARQQRQRNHLAQITTRINAGLTLSEILENIYEDFRELIPYNRIGLALIQDDGETICSQWAKSDHHQIRLRRGYCDSLSTSSLGRLMETGEPRILNDLVEYLRNKPESESTRLIVEEGYQSSLTCPLLVNGRPIGFIFFSSEQAYTYQYTHIEVLQQIADQLAIIVKRGQLASELAAQKRSIERQNHELVHLNKLKNTFVGIVAHDLRSPLGVIEMAINYLQNPHMDMSPEDRAGVLNEMGNHTRHMINLIDELLDVTKIESGTLELNREIVDLAQFVDSAIHQHTRLAAPKDTHIVLIEYNSGSLAVDPQRLRQVIDNLISNAVKYSPPGSEITIRSELSDSHWIFSVKDEGPGIKPEERDHLFKEFGRLSSRPTGGERSTGLGLAISRRMIEAHGGEIGVDSEPGQGSIFWFKLPLME